MSEDRGMNRHARRAKAKRILKEVQKLRDGLKMMRENPRIPRFIVDPISNEPIDILDGETDHFLDQLEAVALIDLGKTDWGRA
jgi:hypothetical protein